MAASSSSIKVESTDESSTGLEEGSRFTVDPLSLKPDDMVVHYKYGPAKFVKLNPEVPKGRLKPSMYVYLQFADGVAKLSAKEASRVLYKFGSEREVSRLGRLKDTMAWERRRKKSEQSIRRLVLDMMDLQVKRLKLVRERYNLDKAAMDEFIKKFPFNATPDQVQAVKDIEDDMAVKMSPMDRLVCGDVGFGKTEVAMRAIFVAVHNKRQVMVLAPTTVLARQHFQVISRRFEGYPDVKIAFISRLIKASVKQSVCDAVSAGTVDILVGTHSLLGAGVRYHNLGLLVVDEEQKFGVKHKEKITRLKSTVDVLTLTATPIPRTLYMATNGFRDVSLINTPPPERQPIQSIVCEHDVGLIKRAIQFELNRGGQIFYVVPRIKGIEEKSVFIADHFQDARVDIAHGQLSSEELENAMERFQDGETHILFCTTIIESGLDISRCNTIIIEDVQSFGLSQLYQLRGRVGRSDKEAFAFMLHPPSKLLSQEAKLRLTAISEFSGLGQGFRLAERDMQIRGVGSIFGEEQSGNMSMVGRDLYLHIVQNTLKAIEQQKSHKLGFREVNFEIALDVHIPSEYIPEAKHRVAALLDLENAAENSLESIMDATRALRRKYGNNMPLSVQHLVKLLCVKRAAAELGISRIFTREKKHIIMATSMSGTMFEVIKESMVDEHLKECVTYRNGKIEINGVIALTGPMVIERLLKSLLDLTNNSIKIVFS